MTRIQVVRNRIVRPTSIITRMLSDGLSVSDAATASYVPGGGSSEWADVYVVPNSGQIDDEVMTDGRVIGFEGTSTTEWAGQVTSGNGGSLSFDTNGAYDGEASVLLVPPSAAPGGQGQYVSILRNVDITNGFAKTVFQANLRWVCSFGNRYIDLAAGAKWAGFTVRNSTNLNTNRVNVFEQFVESPYANGRCVAVTVDETASWHGPSPVPECGFYDCGTASQKGLIVRSTANHGGSPQIAGADEPIYFELEFDNTTTRGNSEGRVKLYMATRDGVINKTMEIPLSWDPNFLGAGYNQITGIEWLGGYFNNAGTADATCNQRLSHMAVSVNRDVDDPIGPPPGFFT